MLNRESTQLLLNDISDQIISAIARSRDALDQHVIVDDEARSGIRGVAGIVIETRVWKLAIRAVIETFSKHRLTARKLVTENDLQIEEPLPF